MGVVQDPPPALRLIIRKYALTASAPAGSKELALQSMDTSELDNGAMACVYSAGGASSGITGTRYFYVFDRRTNVSTVTDVTQFAAATGGGVWRRVPLDASYLGVGTPTDTFNAAPVTLTAGGGLISVAALSGFTARQDFAMDVDASVHLIASATGGDIVALSLEKNTDGAGWVALGAQSTRTITLLSNQQTVVPLVGVVLGTGGTSIALRVSATPTVQTGSIPAAGCTLRRTPFTG